jgi:hypothetical protein
MENKVITKNNKTQAPILSAKTGATEASKPIEMSIDRMKYINGLMIVKIRCGKCWNASFIFDVKEPES